MCIRKGRNKAARKEGRREGGKGKKDLIKNFDCENTSPSYE